MNYQGIVIAAVCFLTIGIFHPIVIKAEYYFSKNCWPFFLIMGAGAITGSLFVDNVILSSVLSAFGASSLWSIGELFAQEKRVEKGWFPENPKRKDKKKQNK